jgi:superfamily I DNA and/or RNA helicase
MSTVYNAFLDAVHDKSITYIQYRTMEKEQYFETLQTNIVAEFKNFVNNFVNNFSENLPNINYLDYVINKDNIEIINNYDIIINNLLSIDGDLHFVTSQILIKDEGYNKIFIYPQINKTNGCKIVNMGYIGNLLHQYSASIQIIRNYNKYSYLYDSVLDPTIYIKGDYNDTTNNIDNTKIKNSKDRYQSKAMNELYNNIEIIHGPPGTGKTTLIMDIIKNKIPSHHNILCCAIQNQAIDVIATSLLNNNYNDIVILGNSKKLNEHTNKYHIDNLFADDEFMIKHLEKKTKIEKKLKESELDNSSNSGKYTNKLSLVNSVIINRKKLLIKTKKIIISTIDKTHILNNLANSSIDTIIIDESGATTEMNLVSLFVIKPKNIILIGDHKQLSAFTYSQITPDEQYHNLSLLERFIKAKRKHNMLRIQYRMKTDICNLVSKLFYDDMLMTHHSKISGIKNIKWYDIRGDDRINKFYSYYNIEEINEIYNICMCNKNKNILILTFYNAQLGFLTQKFINFPNITCKTIDSSQGMESDIVILSLVVSINKININKYQSNKKRICVALSRAKNNLYIVGNQKIFYTNPLWKTIIDIVK